MIISIRWIPVLLLVLTVLAGCGDPTPASVERRQRRQAEREAAAQARENRTRPKPESPSSGSPTPSGRPAYDEGQLERLVLVEANRVRRNEGLGTFTTDPAMNRAADGHSQYLVASGQFSHAGQGDSTPSDRAQAANVVYRAYAENLYQSSFYRSRTERTGPSGRTVTYDWMTPETLAREAIQGWLDSPGHRRNLLDPTYSRAGVGVAFSADEGWTVTMVYAD